MQNGVITVPLINTGSEARLIKKTWPTFYAINLEDTSLMSKQNSHQTRKLTTSSIKRPHAGKGLTP